MRTRIITLAMALCMVAFFVGCGPKGSINRAEKSMASARENCAKEYASDQYSRAEKLISEANSLSGSDSKAARKNAREARDLAEAAEEAAINRKDSAQEEAKSAISSAEAALKAAGDAGAKEYASSQYGAAKSKLEAAKKELQSGGCNYLKARDLAREAEALANAAKAAALEAKEAERLRKDAEARKAKELADAMKTLTSWTVVRGDTLWGIAKKDNVYADPFMWPLIYKANRSQIKDPDLIFPKQTFDVPQDYSAGDKKSAIREAKNRPWPVPNYLYDGQ